MIRKKNHNVRAGYQTLTKSESHMVPLPRVRALTTVRNPPSHANLISTIPSWSLPHPGQRACLSYGIAAETKVNVFVQPLVVCNQCPRAHRTVLFRLIGATCWGRVRRVHSTRLESIRRLLRPFPMKVGLIIVIVFAPCLSARPPSFARAGLTSWLEELFSSRVGIQLFR